MDSARTWIPRGLGALAFAMYGLCAPAGFYWLDSAELSGAAVGMGVPHATGFPLYCMIAKLAALVPVGELAWRINLISALCAALAVVWTCRLVIEVGQGAAALAGAVAAGATLAVSLTFFRQATVAEVYAPTAAVLAGSLLLFVHVARGAGSREGLTLAAVAGLGLGVHSSYRLLLALPVIALYSVRLYRGARWPLLAPLLVAVVGVGVNLYLPVRSAVESTALMDWGRPETIEALWRHVTAASIREGYSGQILSGNSTVVFADAARFLTLVADHLGPVCILAALAGAVVLVARARHRWIGAALLVVALGDAVYGFWINPMGIDELQNGVPLAVAICALAGVGVTQLAARTGPAAPFVGAVAAVVIAVPPALLSVPRVWAGASSDLPRRWSEAALVDAPSRAVVLTQSDSTSAGALYLGLVEGARPDVAVLVRLWLSDRDRAAKALVYSGDPGLGRFRESGAGAGSLVEGLLAGGRPLVWELGDDSLPRGVGVRAGPAAVQLMAPGAQQPPGVADIDAAARAVIDLFEADGGREWMAIHTQAHALTNLGRLAFSRGHIDLAAVLFEAAVAVRPQHSAALVNLGAVESRRGHLERAAELTETALAAEPNRVRALINAARYRLALGQFEAASDHIERAIALGSNTVDTWLLAGSAAAELGDRQRARTRFERALAIDPDNAAAVRALGLLEQSPGSGGQ